MPPTPTIPTQDQAYASLGSTYDPQTQLVQSEIDQLAPQQQAQQASLDQAKVNAFKDITDSSNARGVLFSGVPIDQQATYVGTKYLPAVANLASTFQNNKNTLLDKINQINAARTTQAQGIVTDATNAAATAAYQQAKLQASAQSAAASGSTSTASKLQNQSDAVGALTQHFSTLTGKDGFLSPYDYNAGLSAWVQDGYTAANYAAIFGKYKNPNQPKNQYE